MRISSEARPRMNTCLSRHGRKRFSTWRIGPFCARRDGSLPRDNKIGIDQIESPRGDFVGGGSGRRARVWLTQLLQVRYTVILHVENEQREFRCCRELRGCPYYASRTAAILLARWQPGC